MAFTGQRWFFYRGVVHHPVFLFVLFGCFPSPFLVWSAWTPMVIFIPWGLGDLCQSALPHPASLLGTSLLIPDPQGGALHQESSLASWTARFRLPWFRQGVFVTLFAVMPIKDLIGLPQALAEIGMIYSCCSLMLSSDPQTGGVGQNFVKLWLLFSFAGRCYWSTLCSVSAAEKR